MFTDSIDQNKETLGELIRAMPSTQRAKAKAAAEVLERAWHGLRKDHPHDPAFAVGAAWAIYQIAAKLVEDAKEVNPENNGIIRLLS